MKQDNLNRVPVRTQNIKTREYREVQLELPLRFRKAPPAMKQVRKVQL